MSRLYLAVDGGNSKTQVVLGDEHGEVLACVRGSGSCYQVIGMPATLDVLGNLAARALKEAGLPAGTVVDRAEYYLAGADLPAEVDLLTKAIGDLGLARELRVDNDLFALLRAGSAAPDAVGVVCGAGINGVGRRADGTTSRFLALGTLSGDWGGGHHLAQLALWHAIRGEDGRGPATALTATVAEYFDRPTVEDIAAGIHLGEIDAGRVDGLSRVLFTVAEAGDAVARSVVDLQVDEVVALATIAARRLGLLDQEFEVVLGGGVLTARHPQLHEGVLAGIGRAAPAATVRVLADPPVAGAALLAMDAWGVTEPRREEALRAAVRTATA
jgi:N-acetylglucosamine kinase-like BadF-type ATPase